MTVRRAVDRPARHALPARRRRRPARALIPDLKLIPVGYGVAIIGLITLGIGGPTDLIWHEAYGFEVGVDAIYSAAAPDAVLRRPAGLLDRHPLDVGQAGPRSWTSSGFAPVLLSTELFIGVAGFITMYLSAFMTNVTPTSDFVTTSRRFKDDFDNQSIEPQRRPDRLRRRQLAVLLLQRRPRHGDDHHHDAGPARPDAAAAAPLAPPVRRLTLIFTRLRPAGEHHDRVPRRGR